jgi:hypothetical protein
MRTVQRLWFTPNRTRRFLIPTTAALPEGYDTLVTATGEERLVTMADAQPYEISAEEAQTWARQELAHVARQLQDANPFRRKDPAAGQQQGQGQVWEGRASSTPGLDLLADLTRTPRETLEGTNGAIGRALGDYVRDIGSTVADALSGDPERKEQAERRMRQWAAHLRDHGIAAPDVKQGPKEDRNQPGDRSFASNAVDETDCPDQGFASDG